MNLFEIVAILITLSALFTWVNHRYSGLTLIAPGLLAQPDRP